MRKLLAIALLLAATPSAAIQRYSQTALPVGFVAGAVNSAGDFFGNVVSPNYITTVPAVLSGGVVTTYPGGAAYGRAWNDSGTMIGVTIDGHDHAFIRQAGGSWTELTYPNATDIQVFDINESGVVAGTLRVAGPYNFSGFTYHDGVYTLLPPELEGGGVFQVTDSGDLLGRFGYGAYNFVQIDGIITKFYGNGFIPAALNDNGMVAGFYRDANFRTVAAIWQDGVVHTIGGARTEADWINASGSVLGFDVFGYFIYDPVAGRSYHLGDLVDGPLLGGLSGLLDDGRILTQIRLPDGNFQTIVLTPYGPAFNPVPEPASWALLIAGFGLTGAAMRRRRLLPA